MEYVGADLIAPGNLPLFIVELGELLHPFGLLYLVQPCLEHVHGRPAVLMLGALVLALYNDSCGDMDYSDGRGRLVDVLSSCPAGPEGLCLQVFLPDFYFAFLLNLREDVYGGKRGVSPLVGVKR